MLAATQIIRHARATGAYIAFHRREIVYLCKEEGLTDCQKLIWLWLARHSAWNATLSTRRAQSTIGKALGKSRVTVNKALKALSAQGFLRCEGQQHYTSTYYTQLPAAGMAFLSEDILRTAIKKAAPTLQDYRQHGFYTCLHVGELDFVLEHPMLGDGEKLAWILFANQSAGSGLRVHYTFNGLDSLFPKKADTVYRILLSLRDQGFFKIMRNIDTGQHCYTLCLPSEGLHLLQAAKARTGTHKQLHQNPPVFFAQDSENLSELSEQTLQVYGESEAPSGANDTPINTANTCNTKIINNNTCNQVDKLAPVSEAEAAAQSTAIASLVHNSFQKMALENLKGRAQSPSASTSTTAPVLVAQETALKKEDEEDLAKIPPLSACVPICPEQEPWAMPMPLKDYLHPPGDVYTPLSADLEMHWRLVGLALRNNAVLSITEDERVLVKRAERRVSLHRAPFEPKSRFDLSCPDRRAQAMAYLHRCLANGQPLTREETRHWQQCFVQRCKLLAFDTPNYYVFHTFDPLPQLLIRVAMRSPLLPPLPKAAPAPSYKSTYGDYPIAPNLEARIKQEIPRFIREGEFDPSVAQCGSNALEDEILFYVAGTEKAIEQAQRCSMAYMKCRDGKWRTPIGMRKG